MPIYEYQCSECLHKFELKRSFSDDSPVLCPQCESNAVRIFSPVPIIFKGSGFYSTDHRNNHGHSTPSSSPDETSSGDTKAAKNDSAAKAKTGDAGKSD